MFAGSRNFTTPENLKCGGNKDYIDVKISHFPYSIHHSKGNIILFQKHMSQVQF